MVTNTLMTLLYKIFALWLGMYALILVIARLRKKKVISDIKPIKENILLARYYLDQFYITNIYFTLFISFLYLFSIAGIFIIFRYLYLQHLVPILRIENMLDNLLLNCLGFIIIIITIILYKALITILLYKEINKLYIYLSRFDSFETFFKLVNFKLGDYIFGMLFLATYRIATLTYRENMYPSLENEQIEVDYILDSGAFFETEYVIENKTIIKGLYKLLALAKKYIYIKKSLLFLAYLFRFIFKHIKDVNSLFPSFICLIVFLYDINHHELYYIYYVSFIYILINTKRNISSYNKNRCFFDRYLSEYFYHNDNPYDKQRRYFYQNADIRLDKIEDSTENTKIIQELGDIVAYAFNNFKTESFLHEAKQKHSSKKEPGVYRRFWVIITALILGYILISNENTLYISNIPVLLLLSPILFMFYSHIKTYRVCKFNINCFYEEYIYNRTSNILFWLFTIIQGYIFWLILFKPELMFMNTEILLQLPGDIIKITRIYSFEEKIMYLHQYFEYYLISNEENLILDTEYLRHRLRHINFMLLLDNTITLNHIQEYIAYIVTLYIEHEKEVLRCFWALDETHNLMATNAPENPWFVLLRNTLGIAAILYTIVSMKNYVIIAKQLHDPEYVNMLVKIIGKLFNQRILRDMTLEEYAEWIIKIILKSK